MAERKAGTRRISDQAVRARTGKGWEEWFAILDTWGAKEKGHTLSARDLAAEHDVDPWWAQSITIRYEWERGLRKE